MMVCPDRQRREASHEKTVGDSGFLVPLDHTGHRRLSLLEPRAQLPASATAVKHGTPFATRVSSGIRNSRAAAVPWRGATAFPLARAAVCFPLAGAAGQLKRGALLLPRTGLASG